MKEKGKEEKRGKFDAADTILIKWVIPGGIEFPLRLAAHLKENPLSVRLIGDVIV